MMKEVGVIAPAFHHDCIQIGPWGRRVRKRARFLSSIGVDAYMEHLRWRAWVLVLTDVCPCCVLCDLDSVCTVMLPRLLGCLLSDVAGAGSGL